MFHFVISVTKYPGRQNFAINAAEAQLAGSVSADGELTPTGNSLELVDKIFTCLFAFELVINAYAHWWRPHVQRSCHPTS